MSGAGGVPRQVSSDDAPGPAGAVEHLAQMWGRGGASRCVGRWEEAWPGGGAGLAAMGVAGAGHVAQVVRGWDALGVRCEGGSGSEWGGADQWEGISQNCGRARGGLEGGVGLRPGTRQLR